MSVSLADGSDFVPIFEPVEDVVLGDLVWSAESIAWTEKDRKVDLLWLIVKDGGNNVACWMLFVVPWKDDIRPINSNDLLALSRFLATILFIQFWFRVHRCHPPLPNRQG